MAWAVVTGVFRGDKATFQAVLSTVQERLPSEQVRARISFNGWHATVVTSRTAGRVLVHYSEVFSIKIEGSQWFRHGVFVPRYAKQSITSLLVYYDEKYCSFYCFVENKKYTVCAIACAHRFQGTRPKRG